MKIILEIPFKFDIDPRKIVCILGKKDAKSCLYETMYKYIEQLIKKNKFKNDLKKIANDFLSTETR